jgi:hypothetical protein
LRWRQNLVHLEQHQRSPGVLRPAQGLELVDELQHPRVIFIQDEAQQLGIHPLDLAMQRESGLQIAFEDRFQPTCLCGGQAKIVLNRRITPPAADGTALGFRAGHREQQPQHYTHPGTEATANCPVKVKRHPLR